MIGKVFKLDYHYPPNVGATTYPRADRRVSYNGGTDRA